MTPPVASRLDVERRLAVITTTFPHPPEVVWALFADPDRLARWWGPPGMPMLLTRHDLRAGGGVELTVTTPGGDIRGRWDIHAVTPPTGLRFTFSSDGIDPSDVDVAIATAEPGATTLTVTVGFRSDADVAHALAIGFVDGVTRSVGAAHGVVGPG